MNYNITISGSGTPKEIAQALASIIFDLGQEETGGLDGAVWEDPILITEIKENNDGHI